MRVKRVKTQYSSWASIAAFTRLKNGQSISLKKIQLKLPMADIAWITLSSVKYCRWRVLILDGSEHFVTGSLAH